MTWKTTQNIHYTLRTHIYTFDFPLTIFLGFFRLLPFFPSQFNFLTCVRRNEMKTLFPPSLTSKTFFLNAMMRNSEGKR